MDLSLDWGKILHDMAENVRSAALTALPKRGTMNHFKFKEVLDSQAQDAIVKVIRENNLPAKLVSEEGDIDFTVDKYIITADPVDGTTNLSRGLQPSVTSISIAKEATQNDVIAGIVTDIYSGETFFAETGEGATRNGFPIKIAEPIEYRHALISMDISRVPNPKRLIPLITRALHIRSEGCTAISLCHVACGILDAHIDLRGIVRATDISAGLLILQEAGGIYEIDRETRGNLPLKRDTHVELIAASSQKMLEQINKIIKNS